MNSDLLKRLEFFDGLSVSELNRIKPYISNQSFSSGQQIFEQGSVAKYIFLLRKGIVEIVFKPDDGPSMRVTTIHPGGIFGWSAALGNFLYTSGAICKEDCRTLKMSRADISVFKKKYPELGLLLLDRLTEVVSGRWETRKPQSNSILIRSFFNRNLVYEE